MKPEVRNYCHRCQANQHYFDKATAAVIYNDPMQQLIHLFKYQSKTYLKNIFVQLLEQFISTYQIDLGPYDFIVPIPVAYARYRERGYNQSQLMAQDLGRKYGIELSEKNLVKIRNTQNQALLRKKERWTNIQGAFRINNPSEFEEKTILLFDDLLTTGATVSEAARMLKEAGAKSVDVLTLAIAL